MNRFLWDDDCTGHHCSIRALSGATGMTYGQAKRFYGVHPLSKPSMAKEMFKEHGVVEPGQRMDRTDALYVYTPPTSSRKTSNRLAKEFPHAIIRDNIGHSSAAFMGGLVVPLAKVSRFRTPSENARKILDIGDIYTDASWVPPAHPTKNNALTPFYDWSRRQLDLDYIVDENTGEPFRRVK